MKFSGKLLASIIPTYLGRRWLFHFVLGVIGVCLILAANSHAAVRRHRHAACCCPFSGLVPLIITTQVAAHQSPSHHVRLRQTRCLQHPTGTTSPPPCAERGGTFHSCIVIFCLAACIAPFYSWHIPQEDALNAAGMQQDKFIWKHHFNMLYLWLIPFLYFAVTFLFCLNSPEQFFLPE